MPSLSGVTFLDFFQHRPQDGYLSSNPMLKVGYFVTYLISYNLPYLTYTSQDFDRQFWPEGHGLVESNTSELG